MTGDRTNPPEPQSRPMTLALAGVGVLAAGMLPVVFSFLPPAAQPWNLSVIGAVALFAAARFGFWTGLAFVAAAIAAKDAAIYALHGWPPYPYSWPYFAGYALIGWAVLRRSDSGVRIGATALSASLLFFVISNFVSWLEQALPYGYSLEGLANCFAAGVPFYRGTLIGDLVFSAGLFGAHAVLSRAYFPAERVAVAEPVRDEVAD